MTAPEYCPNCGAAVPPNARACPECGSDESTGWSESADQDRLGLPSDEFDYDEFVRNEFGAPKKSIRPRGISLFWWITAVVVVLALLRWFL